MVEEAPVTIDTTADVDTYNPEAPDGAYVIANLGDNTYSQNGVSINVSNWGQNASESMIRSLFELPALTIGNALSVLGEALSRMGTEVLKFFSALIPDPIEDWLIDVGTAVGKIIAALDPRRIPYYLDQFMDWLGSTFNHLASEFSQIMEILAGGIVTAISAAVQAVKDAWNGTVSTISGVVTGLGNAIDAVVRGLTGWVGSNYTHQEAEQSAATIAKQQADTAASVAVLQQLNSGYAQAGNSVIVNFSTRADASAIGADFDQLYTGSGADTLGIVNGRVDVTPKSYANHQGRTAYWTYNAKETLSDYQRVSTVFGGKPSKRQYVSGFQTFYRYGYNYIRARVAKTGTYAGIDCVMAVFSEHDITLGCFANGVWTEWITYTHSFQVGAIYSLDAGGTGGDRQFRILLNGANIATYNEVGTASKIGADYRRGGGGGQWNVGGDSVVGWYPAAPGAVAAFYLADNAATTVLSSIGKAFSSGLSTSSLSASTLYDLPSGWFNNIDYKSADLTWNSTAGTWTVTKRGNYTVTLQSMANSTSKSGVSVIQKNGANTAWGSAGVGSQAVITLPLEPGDYVGARYFPHTSATVLTGDGAGSYCYFSIARVTPDILEETD